MPAKPRHTQTYSRDADWLGTLDDDMRETLLGYLEGQRHAIVEGVKTGKEDADSYYNVAKLVLDDLIPDHTYPEPDVFANFPDDAKSRVIQRVLTDFSQRLDKVVIPPPPQGGGGGGGDGDGQPQQGNGKGQPQGGGGRPQPAKPGKGEGKQPQPKPQPAQPAKPEKQEGAGGGGKPSEKPPELSDFGLSDESDFDEMNPEWDLDKSVGTKLTTDEDLLAKGISYDDLNESEYAAGSGGEQILSSQRDAGVFYAVRDLVNKIAFDTDFSHTLPDGSERWSLPRVFKSAYNPNYLRDAKQDYGVTVENIYLSLDTSGSVAHMAPTIASLAGGAAGIVHLYHGTEGRPEYKIMRDEPLKYPGQPFPEWDDGNTHPLKFASLDRDDLTPEFLEFAKDFKDKWGGFYPNLNTGGGYGGQAFEIDFAWWLHLEKPPPGSFLLFWGDTEGLGVMAPRLFKTLLRPYKFAWLYPYAEERAKKKAHNYGYRERWKWHAGEWPPDEAFLDSPADFTSVETFKFQALGLPVFYDIADASTIRSTFQRIQTLKGGMG